MRRALVSLACFLIFVPFGTASADNVRPILAFTSAMSEDGFLGAYVLYSDRSVVQITPDKMLSLDPAWSPDGSRLAFYGNQYVCASTACNSSGKALWVASADGSSPVMIYREEGWYPRVPEWSADGKSIIFVRHHDPAEGEEVEDSGIWITREVAPGAWSAEPLLDTKHSEGWFGLTADGTRIVFEMDRDRDGILSKEDATKYDLYTAAADGSGEYRRLTRWPGNEFNPAWSPDGKHIVFENRDGIWVMRRNGSDKKLIFSPPAKASVGFPDYSPGGRRIGVTNCRTFDACRLLAIDVAPPHRVRVLYDSPTSYDGLHDYFPVP